MKSIFTVVKKQFICISFLSLITFFILTRAAEREEKNHSLSFRAAYFRPTSSRVRDIYSHFIADLAFEGNRKICSHAELWAAIDWFSAKGCSICFEETSPTRLTLIPLSIGLKYIGTISEHLQGYIGGGLACSILRIHDEYPYVQQHVKDTSTGAVFKSGLRFGTQRIFAEAFVDYLYQKFDFGCCAPCNLINHNLDISGLKAGIGFGFNF